MKKTPGTTSDVAAAGAAFDTTAEKLAAQSKKKLTASQLLAQRKNIAHQVLVALEQRYPEPATHLNARSAWELLVATILSAQCTDERVNMVTPHLFARWDSPHALATAEQGDVEECIRSTGFFRNKAKNIIAAAERIVTVYGGNVPTSMQELITLPGVARKTANVVLWTAFGKNEGIAVDTHVKRIVSRLGLVDSEQPEAIEKELMALFPRQEWGNVNHRLVWFGRHVCIARQPQCMACELRAVCAQQGLVGKQVPQKRTVKKA